MDHLLIETVPNLSANDLSCSEGLDDALLMSPGDVSALSQTSWQVLHKPSRLCASVKFRAMEQKFCLSGFGGSRACWRCPRHGGCLLRCPQQQFSRLDAMLQTAACPLDEAGWTGMSALAPPLQLQTP